MLLFPADGSSDQRPRQQAEALEQQERAVHKQCISELQSCQVTSGRLRHLEVLQPCAVPEMRRLESQLHTCEARYELLSTEFLQSHERCCHDEAHLARCLDEVVVHEESREQLSDQRRTSEQRGGF